MGALAATSILPPLLCGGGPLLIQVLWNPEADTALRKMKGVRIVELALFLPSPAHGD